MSGRQPEEKVRVTALSQRWRDVLFLNWAYPGDVIAPLLPEGLQPDLIDGDAWVSLVLFRVEDARIGGLAPLLRPTFPETNLRTYVVGPDGRDGIYFLTLEVASIASTLGGRLGAGVPYRMAKMHIDRLGDELVYTSERRGERHVCHDIAVRPGEPIAEPERRDDWLTGRWRAWTRVPTSLATVAVEHQPWPLHRVEVTRLRESVRAAHGVPPSERAMVAHWSPGVDIRLSPPRPHLHAARPA